MHYGMRSDRFPRLFSYSQALHKEAAIKPYSKGKVKGLKPLAERRRHWLTIRLADNADVVIKMYDTDIITYKPDGHIIVRQGGWSTSSTHETIATILGTTVYQRHSKAWIECIGGAYILREKEDNVFKRSDDARFGKLEYVNPVYPTKHVLKKKEYNQIRKLYADFTKYAVGLAKLGGDDEALRALAWETRGLKVHELMLSNDTEDNYKAYAYLYATRSRYHRPDKEILGRINCVIKNLYKNTVFEEIEVRDGRIVRDSNGEYFV